MSNIAGCSKNGALQKFAEWRNPAIMTQIVSLVLLFVGLFVVLLEGASIVS